MFITLHDIDTNESVIVNTANIVVVSENVYDDYYYDKPPRPGATLTVRGYENTIEVKESVGDIERLMKQARA